MSNHFETIGIPIADRKTFEALMHLAATRGQPQQFSEGYYICWSLGKGVELWAQATQQRELCGLVPHVSGTSRISLHVQEAVRASGTFFDGGLFGEVLDEIDNSASSLYPLFVDLPDFSHAMRQRPWPAKVSVQVAAFAHQIRCFANPADFESDEVLGGLSQKAVLPRFAAGTSRSNDRYRAEAIMNGIVRSYEMRTNPLTSQDFAYIGLETLGGCFDVVAAPSALQETPVVGGIVWGSFWLSGRIILPISN